MRSFALCLTGTAKESRMEITVHFASPMCPGCRENVSFFLIRNIIHGVKKVSSHTAFLEGARWKPFIGHKERFPTQ